MSRIKVLIAEDNGELVTLYDKGLRDELFEKAFAGDGEEALNLYESFHPDLIILDIMMPIKSGYTVLLEIRRDFGDKTTPIIITTSLSRENDVKDCMKIGIQGYIVKPFNHRTIGRRIIEYYEKAKGIGKESSNG